MDSGRGLGREATMPSETDAERTIAHDTAEAIEAATLIAEALLLIAVMRVLSAPLRFLLGWQEVRRAETVSDDAE